MSYNAYFTQLLFPQHLNWKVKVEFYNRQKSGNRKESNSTYFKM